MTEINKGLTYWGFNHKKVIKHYKGTRFINEFQIKKGNSGWSKTPSAVYFSKNPDKSKGHTPYFFVFISGGLVYVGGLTDEEVEENRYQDALLCHNCDEIIYSKHRNDLAYCSCGKNSIDGGRDYTQSGGECYQIVKFDLLTENFDL